MGWKKSHLVGEGICFPFSSTWGHQTVIIPAFRFRYVIFPLSTEILRIKLSLTWGWEEVLSLWLLSRTLYIVYTRLAMATWRIFHHDGKISPEPLGGGCTPTPFHYIYHHVQSCILRSNWEGRYTLPISTLPLYVLCGSYTVVQKLKSWVCPELFSLPLFCVLYLWW